jgi:hypothetical protein
VERTREPARRRDLARLRRAPCGMWRARAHAMHKTLLGPILVVSLLAATGCKSEAKKALEGCDATNGTTSDGLKTCFEAWKQYSEEPEWGDITRSFDARLEEACKDDKRIKDCDEYCPKRIKDPGPKNKTMALSMCVAKGYGTLDGKVTDKKPPVVSEMSPEVIEPCVVECKPHAANPSSPEYQGCFSACKTKKVAELNAR